jgi:hypothetical protein
MPSEIKPSKDVIGHVIDRTALIENMLNQVIYSYIRPSQDAFQFFWDVLLDGSIITLGAKIKIANAISHQLNSKKLKDGSLHDLVSYRNAFSHHATNAHPTLIVGRKPEGDELHYMLHILKPSGKTESKTRDQALVEFDKNFELAKNLLRDLLDAIEAQQQRTTSI